MDKRKRPICGQWERNGRYYAQFIVEDPVSGFKRVKRGQWKMTAAMAQTVAKLQEPLTERRKGSLPVLKRTSLFADYARQYFDFYEKVKDAKRKNTLCTERIIINRRFFLCGGVHLPNEKCQSERNGFSTNSGPIFPGRISAA